MIPPAVRALANQVANALDIPEWFPAALSSACYSIGGPVYDGFERALIAAAPGAVASARQWCAADHHAVMKAMPLADPVAICFWLVFYLVALVMLYPVSKFVAYPSKLEMKSFSLCHNVFLCVLSGYMAVSVVACAIADDYSLVNNAPSGSKRMARACWVFVVSKIPEFIDTFIMMLKQNYGQVSFLHVYHHLSILVFVWAFAYPAPGGDCWVSVSVNSAIHFFMYAYYGLTAFAGKTGPLRAFLNSIKFVITKGQLTQFAMNFLHAAYMVFVLGEAGAKFPLFQMRMMLGYMLTMLGLFGEFLVRNMRAAAAAKRAEKKAAGGAEKPKVE